MTDEQATHAIWELLQKPYGNDLRETEAGQWIDRLGRTISPFIAHRAILDAAREVLDLAVIEINPPGDGNSGWVWYTDEEFCTEQEDVYDTRTQCTYHALAWLKGWNG